MLLFCSVFPRPRVVLPSCRRRVAVLRTARSRRSISRVLSACAVRPFLWGRFCNLPLATNPGGGTGMVPAFEGRPSALAAPIRSCSRWGFPCRPCRQDRGALLPHHFTLTLPARAARAVCFLWHFPWGRPRRPLAGTAFPWSPDFPPPPGNPAAAAVRPSGWPRLRLYSTPVNSSSVSRRIAAARARVASSAPRPRRSGRKCRWKARTTTSGGISSA